MRLFKYKIAPKPNPFATTPVGGHVSIDRSAFTASLGVRGWYGVCVIVPLESQRHWQRRHQQRHESMVRRLLA